MKLRSCAVVLALAACGDNSKTPGDAAPQPDALHIDAAVPDAPPSPVARNVIFFLGDGMGVATITAARIYAAGEDGDLTMDTLPESAWVRTYSHDALVTDSAPSMSAYMTGVKMNNEVIAMSPDTRAIPPGGGNTIDNCASSGANGTPVATLLEQAIAAHRATGVVTTTRITHATPASTYAHICHRDLENAIAAQVVPGGAGYNAALGAGLDVMFGGGRRHFLPAASGGTRTDGRNLVAELQAAGYSYAADRAAFVALDPATTTRAVGLFTASHMSYELDRNITAEPSLAEMTLKAIEILRHKPEGFFLMVEGGRIDHALHETNAKRALVDTLAFDAALGAAIAKIRETDPTLEHTLIVVTADHDHTMTLNGYAKRTGATSAGNAGVLGIVKDPVSGQPSLDADGQPYSIIGFGNGERRIAGDRSTQTALTDSVTAAAGFHQEAAVLMPAGGETHGGTDVSLMAIGDGSDKFHGFLTNTSVYDLLHAAAGF